MTKKIFAMFLAVLMVVSMLPTSVFAASCPGKGNEHTKSNCDFTEVGKTAPNCGNKGYTTYKCNTCNDTFVADFVNPVGEHTWVDAKDVPETCEKDGETGGKECSVCHEKVGATKVDKIPNGLKCEWTEWAPADVDCTTGGKQTATCKHCGDVKEQEVPKAEGGRHVMGDWELKTPATAEANGLAVQKCQNPKCGYTVEQAVLFDHDHDDEADTLIFVAEIAEKCEETGIKAHFECRVCGQKFVFGKASATATKETYNLVTDADLVIKTKHDQIRDGLTCMSTTYVCNEPGCGKVIKVDAAAAHKYGEWEEVVKATCTTDGFKSRECEVDGCPNTQTEIIPALKHIEASTEVVATCVQYAYTFTYCLRPGCANLQKTTSVKIGDKEVDFDLTVGEAVLEAPVVGIPFYFKALRNNVVYYIAGGNNEENRVAATQDITNAAQFYLELADVESEVPAYNLYYYNDGNKTYITIAPDANDNSIITFHYSLTAPKDYFVWNEEFGVLTIKNSANGKTYFFGMNTKGENFAGINVSNLTVEQVGVKRFTTIMLTSNANGVALLNITPNVTAGFDNTNHRWKNLTNQTASCMNDVVNSFLCEDCGASKTEKLDKLADHNWDNGTVTKEATCTEKGEKLYTCQCKGCNVTKKEEIAAKNHSNLTKENNQVKVFTEPGNHTSPISYKYNECYDCKERVNKTEYKAWADAGKLWDSIGDAENAHGKLTPVTDAKYNPLGSCTEYGYNSYTCKVCTEIVRVKRDGTGKHTYASVDHLDPTCTANGFDKNLKCTVCGLLKDETKAEGYEVVIPALGHTWKTFSADEREDLDLGDYVKAPCGTPNYENWIGYCSVCYPDGITANQFAAEIAKLTDDVEENDNIAVLADTKLVDQKHLTGALCTATVYELYECHCGETHMRGYLVAGKNVNHEYIVDATATKKEATHFEEGHIDMVCKYCGAEAPEAMEIIAKLPHMNAAKEEFTDHCNDTVTDRHCVLCCAVKCVDKDNKKHDCAADQKADEEGVQDCDCIIGKHHDWSEKTYVGSICGDAPYYSEICAYCYETKAVDAEEYWTGALNEKGEKVMAPIFGLGHKPVAADADKYGQYTYVKIVHPEYVWENGVVIMTEASKVEYEAKYIEYKAATFTTDGFAKFVCADCGKTIEAVLPATAGLGFELVVENANGQAGITMGSVVNVTLYANGNNVEVNNFTLIAEFEDMIFVGAKPATNDFNIHVTKSENANKDEVLAIIANAVNSADKKQQNITIGEKTPIVVMHFIAANDGEAEVEMNGQAYALNGTAVNCGNKTSKIEVKEFLDFNEDGAISIIDLVQAEAILTGESEKTYDVSVDVDKDGEITLYDLNLIYEFMVNSFSADEEAYVEFICTGLSEEHAAIVRAFAGMSENKKCNNPNCNEEILPGWTTCPVCGNKQ